MISEKTKRNLKYWIIACVLGSIIGGIIGYIIAGRDGIKGGIIVGIFIFDFFAVMATALEK